MYATFATTTPQPQHQCVLIAVHADGEVRVWGMPTNDTLVYTPLHTSTNGVSTLMSNGRSDVPTLMSSDGTVCVGSVMASSQQQLQQQPLSRAAAR
jgi:WD40 repeat protein